MIIIGVYPDQIYSNQHTLRVLKDELLTKIPENIVLHLLPFLKSCGDGGYAISDWYEVEEVFGDWSDIKEIAKERRLIVDGVFNHIGIKHKRVKDFCENPKRYKNWFYINLDKALNSPRGQEADRNIQTVEGNMKIRQTHMEQTVDINLENPEVQKEIKQYLTFLKEKGIWGIRLDAVAYYKKGALIRHNKGAEVLADKIADMVKNSGFYALAQLDCDEQGRAYFLASQYKDVAIYDFSYSAYLCEAIISKKTEVLSWYLMQTSLEKRILIRAPRTHDGILLKSGNLTEECKAKIINYANNHGIAVRRANGSIYELNCSLPYLFYIIYPKDVHKLVRMTIAFTGILNSIPYYYFPYMEGYIPEQGVGSDYISERFDKEDLRTMNRMPVPIEFVHNHPAQKELRKLLDVLSEIHSNLEEEMVWGEAKFESFDSYIKVSVANGKIIAYFNFSSQQQKINTNILKDYSVAIKSTTDENFGAYDFIIYTKNAY